jgi:ribonucleoside-diphosphate reductase alpha chain
MTAESYKTSAEMAKFLGAFSKFELNREHMLRVMRNHRRAAFNAPDNEYEKLVVKPIGINPQYAPAYLLAAARESWNEAVDMGEKYGYRNAQTTLLAPTGTIGLLMDCATTGVEPDFALVKFKKLAGGGYFRIVNDAVPMALQQLGYTPSQMQGILNYMRGTADITNAPHINATTLKQKGFIDADIKAINKALEGAFDIKFACNVWTLGEEAMKRAGFSEAQYNDPKFNMLAALGFTDKEIEEANDYTCGTMTIEGAPGLQKEHYAVFDTANRNGKKGKRFIHYMGHVKMMAAVQPFLSGAISKTINMPHEITLNEVKHAYEESWKVGLKAVALYRDGCKLSQPLSSTSSTKKEEKTETEEKTPEVVVTAEPVKATTATVSKMTSKVEMSDALMHASEILSQHAGVSSPMESYTRDGEVAERRVYLHGENADFLQSAVELRWLLKSAISKSGFAPVNIQMENSLKYYRHVQGRCCS